MNSTGDFPGHSSGHFPGRDDDATFQALFTHADAIPGWLTRDQARRLYDEARAVLDGSRIVEIGSHRGRSTVVLAGANPRARVTAIDAFVEGPRYGGADTERVLRDNLDACGVADRVDLVVGRSERLRPGWREPIALLFVDGKHDVLSAADDFRWAAYLTPGARMLVHDAFSSIGVTLAVLARLLPSSSLRYTGRVGSLATFERARPAAADRLRILGELPWWLRNVGIKILLRLRLRPLARLVGHHDTADPY